MKSTVSECLAPSSSTIAGYLPGAYFHDAWCVSASDPSLSALGQFLKAIAATPKRIETLMGMRNRAVAVVGLKNLGGLSQFDPSKPEHAYQPGDRVGIFTLIQNSPNEVLMGDSDRHLDVTLSVHVARSDTGAAPTVTVTTVVHVHNLLGRLYMLPVAPAHRVIAPRVLKTISAH